MLDGPCGFHLGPPVGARDDLLAVIAQAVLHSTARVRDNEPVGSRDQCPRDTEEITSTYPYISLKRSQLMEEMGGYYNAFRTAIGVTSPLHSLTLPERYLRESLITAVSSGLSVEWAMFVMRSADVGTRGTDR